MYPMLSRCLSLFLVGLLVVPVPAWGALSEVYTKGFGLYDREDYRGAVTVLETAGGGDADVDLLLGLSRLRLDDPARAAESWARFIRTSDDAALSGEVARLRTILVREANERAARDALRNEARATISEDVIAVLPFRNVGEPKYEPLGRAIAVMLGANLKAVPGARVVGRGRVAAFLAVADDGRGDTKVARRVGRLLGAGLVVVGAHVDTSSDPMTLEVHSAVIDTSTGERVEFGSFLAPLDRFYIAIRDTAVALSSRLDRPVSSLPPSTGKRVQAIHTESLEAALAFGRGLAFEDAGDMDGARREYERALRADPSFRLARAQLATLPAALISLSAVAAAVQSELPVVEPPVLVAEAPTPTPEATPSPAADASVAAAAGAAAGAVVVAAAPGDDGSETPSSERDESEEPGTTEPEEDGEPGATEPEEYREPGATEPEEPEEETTILGMSPMTAALVGGGLAVAIGAGAAAAGGGGGGGGGDDGGGNQPIRPPTLTGVEDRSVDAGELIVLNIQGQDPEDSTVRLSIANAPAAATFDSSSGNPATGTFRWQTAPSDGGQTITVDFSARASRGPPNDVTEEMATFRVSSAAPTPTPPPTCGGTGSVCTAAAECCQDIPRQCDVTPAGGGTRCCLGLTTACQVDGDCCGSANACEDQRCCAPLGVACTNQGDCCTEGAACGAGACCMPDGESCENDGECCTGRCADGVCEGMAPATPTPRPSPTPTMDMCVERGDACDAAFECCLASNCDQTPTSDRPICCAPLGDACTDDGICCGTNVQCDDVCCRPLRSACSDASECCGRGAGCVLGRCCAPPGGTCTVSQDCCAGACNGGTCSASLSADAEIDPTPTPATRPTTTPTPAPTPTRVPLF